jgi:Lar family restriction alleviation protein
MTTNETAHSPLLPCPFCGGEGRLVYITRIIPNLLWYVECQKCGCKGNWFTRENTKDWEQQAIYSWNARHNAHDDLHEENQQLQQDKIDLANGSNQWAAEASKLHEENTRFRHAIEALADEIDEANEKNTALNQTLESTQQTDEEMGKKLKVQQMQIDLAEAAVDECRGDCKRLQVENVRWANMLKAAEITAHDNMRLEEENQQLRSRNDSLRAKNDTLRQENERLFRDLSEGDIEPYKPGYRTYSDAKTQATEIAKLLDENQRLQGAVEHYAKLFKHLKMGDMAREALKDHKE